MTVTHTFAFYEDEEYDLPAYQEKGVNYDWKS